MIELLNYEVEFLGSKIALKYNNKYFGCSFDKLNMGMWWGTPTFFTYEDYYLYLNISNIRYYINCIDNKLIFSPIPQEINLFNNQEEIIISGYIEILEFDEL